MKQVAQIGKTGFTLIELIVVMALISIVMLTVFPRFQRVLTDPTRAVSRWILLKIPQLKQQAVSENHCFTLHLDIQADAMWTTHDAMSPEEKERAAENRFALPEPIELMDVEFPNARVVSTGEVMIRFYPKGYSDRAIIHVSTTDDTTVSYFIEPFLADVKLTALHVGYTD